MLSSIKQFIAKRQEKAEAQRRRNAKLEREFEVFIEETKPLVPHAPKNPEAALYRHAWRRAEVLRQLLEDAPSDEAADYREAFRFFAKRAGDKYYRVAPSNAYGTVRLEMSAKQATALAEKERLLRQPKPDPRPADVPCIYMATCSRTNKRYIGQTARSPETRWAQHRRDGTGPFKRGAIDPKYDYVEIPITVHRLDERESYFIGFYDTYDNGLNENRGNDLRAYHRGCKDRENGVAPQC